ncbi:MAG: MarR family transcriptional regulator [Burkholderiaceae bacterium]|nr:MarR family transcriptional regulator [Microbacteriaceae bacterium]
MVTHELSSEIRVAVNRLSRRLRAEKADTDLTDGQTTVLGVLSVRGPLTLSELAEIERVTPPSMNRTVGALVDAGYIERETSPDDRRKVFLHLSPTGTELVRETRRRRDEWLYQRLADLSPAERRTLADAATILRALSQS